MLRYIVMAVVLVGMAEPGVAQTKSLSQQWGLSVFPAKNQTKAQQDKDEVDCYNWAKQNTGIDPLAPVQPASAPATPPPQGQAVKGAAKGAAAGAAVGAIAGDAGKGAAAGATVGAMKGVSDKKKDQKAAQQQAAASQQAAVDQTKATFNKGFSACLEGKGYTVK